jgi:hypothetical protein
MQTGKFVRYVLAIFGIALLAGGLSPTYGAGSIQGQLHVDRDCNGVFDAGEPLLASWKVYLRGTAGGLPVLDSATTTTDGVYLFGGLAAGDYSVASSQQPDYIQNLPVSVDYRLALATDEAVTGRDFSFKAVATCDTTLNYTCVGGVDDNFSTANGPEPSAPSPALLAEMRTCATALAFFDQPATDACFGHTFSNCWGSCGPVRATIQMRLRASSAGSQDDELHFGGWPSPGSIWHISLSNLLEIKTGGADASWDSGDTMTVTLDLADLPVADRGLTNIMAALQDGDLDVYVRNNTEVDFAGGGMGGG